MEALAGEYYKLILTKNQPKITLYYLIPTIRSKMIRITIFYTAQPLETEKFIQAYQSTV